MKKPHEKVGFFMAKKIYIGNLNYATTDDSLKSTFEQYGEVLSAVIIKDRDTAQSKGFGFVELADDAAADRAIEELNGKELDGRRVRVNFAEERPQGDRPRRSFNRGPRRNFDRDRDFDGNRY